jgi:hypothetical protein
MLTMLFFNNLLYQYLANFYLFYHDLGIISKMYCQTVPFNVYVEKSYFTGSSISILYNPLGTNPYNR